MKRSITKKIFALFAIIGLSVSASVSASAEEVEAPVVAIIDSGFDTSQLGDSVIQEACVVAFWGCGTDAIQVGPGTSGTENELKPRYLQDWQHGTNMALAMLEVNPNTKFVLVRNAKVYHNVVSKGSPKDFTAALQWIEDNAATYGIDAVSFSRGSHRYVSQGGGDVEMYKRLVNRYDRFIALYERLGITGWFVDRMKNLKKKYEDKIANAGTIECPASTATSTNVKDLLAMGIPTFIAAGNSYDKRYIDSPACIDEAIAVSASDQSGQLIKKSNFSPTKTDFVVPGPDTSTATAKLAAMWVHNNNIAETGTPVSDSNAILVTN